MQVKDIPEVSNLSTPEKILFVEDLWDSISSDVSSIPVPESHKMELDDRLARFESTPGALLSLEELQANVDSRK